MRMHIELDHQLMAEVDRLAGPRGRSAFVRLAIEAAVEQAKRWELLEQSAGALNQSHEWDDDPAAWVREQRRSDSRRVG